MTSVSGSGSITFVDHTYSLKGESRAEGCKVCIWLNKSWNVPSSLHPELHKNVETWAQYFFNKVRTDDSYGCTELKEVFPRNIDPELCNLFYNLFKKKTAICFQAIRHTVLFDQPPIHKILISNAPFTAAKPGVKNESWAITLMWSSGLYLKPQVVKTRKVTYLPEPHLAYRQFFQHALEGTNTDAVILVGKSAFTVHKLILSEFSSYFSTMLRTSMKEGNTSTIEINDVSPLAMKAYLEFLYTRQIEKIEDYSLEVVMDIFRLAHRGMNDDLLQYCLVRIQELLTPDNFYAFFLQAMDLDSPLALKACCEMITGNKEALGEFKKTLSTLCKEHKDWKKLMQLTFREDMPDIHQLLINYSEFHGEEWFKGEKTASAAAASSV